MHGKTRRTFVFTCAGLLLSAACGSDRAPGGVTGIASQSTGGASGGRPAQSSGGSSAGTHGAPTASGGYASDPIQDSGNVDARTQPEGSVNPDDSGLGPAFESIRTSYRAFQPQTPGPIDVSSYIFALCRLPTLPEQQFAESEHGNFRRLQDWANAEAVSGIQRRGSPAFPPGAVIVKEKYVMNQEGANELVALGFMVKRPSGFDPTRGDWDYAYWEPALGLLHTRPQTEYCGGCHLAAAETDYVYIDGLRPF